MRGDGEVLEAIDAVVERMKHEIADRGRRPTDAFVLQAAVAQVLGDAHHAGAIGRYRYPSVRYENGFIINVEWDPVPEEEH